MVTIIKSDALLITNYCIRCSPWPCHGNILIKLYNEFYGSTTSNKDDSKRSFDEIDDAESEVTNIKKQKKIKIDHVQ